MSKLRFARKALAKAVTRARHALEPKQAPPRIVDARFPGKALLEHRTALGTYYLPEDSEADCIAADMRRGRVFEAEVVEVARRYIRQGTTVLDVGSNFGQMALLFSQAVGPEGQVLAFEADDFVFATLQRNLEVNRAHNVRSFLAAVYHTSGRVARFPVQDFKCSSAYGSHGLNPTATAGREVMTLSIDDLAIHTPISFMKVDVQGSDLFALQGAARTIHHHRMPIIFKYQEQFQEKVGTQFQDYLDFLRETGYCIERTVCSIHYLATPDTRLTVPVKVPGRDAPLPDAPRELDPIPSTVLCGFLQSRAEVEACTSYLQRNGHVSHLWPCKDWDLAHILREIGDGDCLDMGSSDSYILRNILLKRVKGEKYGIDLRMPERPLRGVRYLVGDLMQVPCPDFFFDYITCLSVIEHEVDLQRFACETARLLKPGGKLFVTFDYWEPRVRPSTRLYGLRWQPLDRAQVERLVSECRAAGLELASPIDWRIDDAVIRDGYYSPERGIAYTFGLVTFERLRSDPEQRSP